MKTKMIFNITQANLFIEHGCQVIGVGCGKFGKIYLLFAVDETFEHLMDQWNRREFMR